ncbi:MAG: restriction endonuclease subunit S [Candidatus Methanoperedens sp.]|nr:restriction endonuclease subunit S [Candidatus Methanoperedens sp.]
MSWAKYRFGDVCSMVTGKLNSNAAEKNGMYPFFTCSQETFQINEYAFDTEAVLLGGNNAAGIFPLKYYNGKFNAYQRTYIIESKDKDKLSTMFLYYSLRPVLSQFQNMSIGAATQYLTKSILDNFEIKLPTILEQRKIASILSAYDSIIENNRRRIHLLERSARLLYREWFVHLRFPGHEHVRIIDGVPEGWEKGTVSDFYKTKSGSTPSRKNPDFFTGEINWVKTQELQDGFIFETDEKITEDAVSNSSAKLFPVNTVLVAMYGATIGQTAILGNPAATNQACCAVFPDAKQTHYIHAYLFLRENKNGLINLSQGAAQKNISQEIIKNYQMTMPSKMIMTEFIESLEPVFVQIKNLQLQNSKLKNARDILLPRLMNGEITV